MPTKILIDALYLYIKCFIADAITDIFILLIYKILLFMKIRLVDNADENPIADAITYLIHCTNTTWTNKPQTTGWISTLTVEL